MSIKLKSPHVVDLRFLMDTFRSLKTLFERVKLTVLLPYSSWVQICGVFQLSRAPDSFNPMFFGHRCVPSLTASVLIFFFPFLWISAHYCFLLQKKPSAPSLQFIFFIEPNAHFQVMQGRVLLVHPGALYQHPALLALCTTPRAASAHFFSLTPRGEALAKTWRSPDAALLASEVETSKVSIVSGGHFGALFFVLYFRHCLTLNYYGQWPAEASEKLRANFNKRLTLRLALINHVASDYSDYCGIRFGTCWGQPFPAVPPSHPNIKMIQPTLFYPPAHPPTSESDPKVCPVGRGGAGGWMVEGITVRERRGHGPPNPPTPKSSPGDCDRIIHHRTIIM